ncbi:bromodomain-containing protein 8 [Anopheles nili]|uniref:bromodomain-containing protein 8 n=1 Tax=Anopheles nili TaxID=185578 RepID=UPI00237C1081|nr:bromodomain-containing protein 8 [Anopheles nili]
MSSIQERLQMKRVPLDKWSTKEKLCLASSVACSGDQNWMSVSRSLKMLCSSNRPNDWFAQKSCAAQYGKLLENVETPKRKKRTASERDGIAAVETPGESILRKLTQERIIELKKIIQEETQQYIKVKEDIILIQSGVTDEKKLREMWKQIEQEKAQKEKEQIQHEEWLKEREEKKLELERQWRPLYPNSPNANKASTPPIKFKEETDEDSQGSCKSGTSPLLTSLLKNPGDVRAPGASTTPATIARSTSSPTITNLLIGTAGNVAKSLSSTTSATGMGDTEHQAQFGVEIKQEALTATARMTEEKEHNQANLEGASTNVSKTDDAVSSGSQKATASNPIKSETLFSEMDSEDNADPAKDLMEALEDLIPDDFDEILKENSGMLLEDVDLKNVVDSIMEEEESTLKEKDHIEMPEGVEDVQMTEIAGNISSETASKNEETSVERIKSPPLNAPSSSSSAAVVAATPTTVVTPAETAAVPLVAKTNVEDASAKKQNEPSAEEKQNDFQKQTNSNVETLKEDKTQETEDSKMEIIPIEDSTSNSPVTNQSSDDNKDAAEDSSGQDQPESVIVVSDSAKEDEEDEDQEAEASSNDAPAAMDDEDSDDKPLASLDVVPEVVAGGTDKTVQKVEDDKMTTKQEASVEEQEKRPSESIMSPADVTLEMNKEDIASLPADEAKAKKEAMEKLASEYDFKDDEEPIVQLSIKKVKEEKHVSEDEVVEDTQDTVDEPEEVKEVEPPVKKPLVDDAILTVTDTDDDSLIEMKIGKAKRDYSRRRLADEAQKLRDDMAGHSRSDETEGRSLRKLRDRDRSESPFVMQDEEPNEKMKRSYSSTPVMDSIPGSPASSEDRDHRAWKKSIMAVYSKISGLKNAAAFQKPLSEEQTSEFIYRPMDLAQIKRNIENGNIRTTAEFQRDIMLMCTNAVMLNRSDLCPPHAASLLMRESMSIIETGMDPKAAKERDNERNTHKRSSRKSTTRNSSAGRS